MIVRNVDTRLKSNTMEDVQMENLMNGKTKNAQIQIAIMRKQESQIGIVCPADTTGIKINGGCRKSVTE